jgi:YD repeat-containing protein
MTYDLGGRKTAMNDPDLGAWSYAYNRRGALRQQTDACGNVTELSYDDLGRLVAQVAAPGALCATTAYTTAVLTTTYVYDGGHGDQSRSRGQLTSVSYGDGSYARSLGYNAKGRLVTETVALAGAPQVYTALRRLRPAECDGLSGRRGGGGARV